MNIKDKNFKVLIRPNSPLNKIIKFDKEKNAYIIDIKEDPRNNKANIELIKFLSNALKKGVKIKAGFKSREKLIEIIN